ncbi:MAG: FAD-dependent oxidoreductase [Rhodoferax sp.]|nr:FAD-dependent oxidoreductase [Rhodoferax sp.]
MKVIVIGSGVVGVTTAYYFAKAGVEVVVVDQHPEPAMGASFGNAGSMTASRAGPWASPRALAKTLKGYYSSDSAFKLHLSNDPALWAWLAGFTKAAFSNHTSSKRQSMIELGIASSAERQTLERTIGLAYGQIRQGLLTVYDSDKEFKRARTDLSTLRSLGLEMEALSVAECEKLEPAVDWDNLNAVGAILSKDDATADCREFTLSLARHLVGMGVQFRHEFVIKVIQMRPGHCEVSTDKGGITADAIVVAAGIESMRLLKPLGIALPMYPVKGYSITLKQSTSLLPSMSISDEARKVFMSPINNQLRAAGIADIAGYDMTISPERIGVIRRTTADFFPNFADAPEELVWSGLRAMTHDGPPLMFGSQDSGVWVNSGHGSLGWTFACGAAKIVSNMVLQKKHEPENPYFGLSRR